MSDELQQGTIVFYRADKFFGFIKPDGTESGDVFFHEQELESDRDPQIGDRVAFTVEPDPRRTGRRRARGVTPISGQS